MESRCYLVISGIEYLIDEPIGMDSFSTKIKRSSDAHGIAFEFSETTLEFYGYAYTLLKAEYDILGVNSVVSFKEEMKWTDNSEWDEYYYGKLDFKTYSETISDFNKISINPSRQTLEETISNRKDLEVQLNTLKGLDGADLSIYPALNKDIELHAMNVILTSKGEGSDVSYTCSAAAVEIGTTTDICIGLETFWRNNGYILFSMVNPIYSELGTISSSGISYITDGESSFDTAPIIQVIPNNAGVELIGNISITIRVKGTMTIASGEYAPDIYLFRAERPFLTIEGGSTVYEFSGDAAVVLGYCDKPETLAYDWTLTASIPAVDLQGRKLCIVSNTLVEFTRGAEGALPSTPVEFQVSSHSDSNFTIVSDSLFAATTAKGAMIHEVASRIIESISDGALAVKSDYYSRTDSDVKHQLTDVSLANTTGLLGFGSMRALFNGYQIRKSVKSDGISEYYISMSWKDLIEQLQAIDNIGYGIEYDAVNGDVLRIEDWRYFYQDDVILTIESPEKKTRTIDTSVLYSKFEAGYSTWESEIFNGQDAFLTARTYRTKTNILDNTLSKLCKWIADGYAIEATRRTTFDKTKDNKYDEKVFIIVLSDDGTDVIYESRYGVVSGINLISPSTVYNAMISPVRNIMKWANKILQIMSTSQVSEGLEFMSGTGNFIAGGEVVNDGISTGIINENDDIKQNLFSDSERYMPILKPEAISLEYPLSIKEYKVIKQNPLGVVLVDNEITYIKEMTYKFAEGKAQFVLIPVYETTES